MTFNNRSSQIDVQTICKTKLYVNEFKLDSVKHLN